MDFTKQGVTSVKVHHAPGGKSNFSLAWDTEPTKPTNPKHVPTTTKPALTPVEPNHPSTTTTTTAAGKTSVKVHNPPGGRSNIVFG